MGKLKVIDFFSGCGGSSLGIEQAGLQMVLAVDLWEDACKTHELNIDCPVWCKDINLIEASLFEPSCCYKTHKIVRCANRYPCQTLD